jgi:hypothetical protein
MIPMQALQMSAPVQEASAVTKAAAKKPAARIPAEHEISAGLHKGLVWTNPTTKVYHKGGEFYGRTKNGAFMTEAEAVRRYYRPSPEVMRARGE